MKAEDDFTFVVDLTKLTNAHEFMADLIQQRGKLRGKSEKMNEWVSGYEQGMGEAYCILGNFIREVVLAPENK